MRNFFSIRIETLGCRLNQVESEALIVKFKELNFPVFINSEEKESFAHSLILKADIGLCILNTCTVTSKAEQKARRIIRIFLKESPKAIVLVTGCYAELEAEKIESIDKRVIAFSGKQKDSLIDLAAYLKIKLENLTEDFTDKLKSEILEFRTNIYLNRYGKFSIKKLFKLSSPVFLLHSRASLKVQDGCNNACSFCRIRLARGKAISLPAEEAIIRLKKIEENGANEVVLTGVNLAQYKDEKYGNFANLLKMLLENTNKIRIRISSLYPETVTEEILPVLKNKRICPHFHLSIQSGSDKILQLMKRPYGRKEVVQAVNYLRSVKENPFIGCDIITGFPSETESDFQETYSLCKVLKISGVHIFPFSARPGTVAFSMKNQIPQRDSGNRASKLNELSKINYNEYLGSCIGKIFFAIVEKPVLNKPIQVITENYLSLELNEKSNFKNFKGGEAIFIKILTDKKCKIETA